VALRILAVDDEPDVLLILKAVGESLGCEVLTMTDSREAAERVDRQEFDGILVDVQMPHLDGFELTKRIRASGSNSRVPVVMLTGYDNIETMRRGYQAGITFFLGKPFTVEKLRGLLAVARGAMLKEKRQYARLPLRTAVTIRAGKVQFKAESLNISEAGLLLEHSAGLAIGQEVELGFSVPQGRQPLRPRAQVVRLETPNRMGVKFLALAPSDQQAIQAYVSGLVKG
jgi:CheY-like chemotaxis protein